MANRLQFENSLYLLQHKDNPVDWYPWGEAAFQKAQSENKPIFLSIGYAACHWCHVMAHESFADPATAELLNRYFVSIKVDREERPDLDNIYMSAVIAMTKTGGWPMSIFLTPQGKPFYGGTYFPPLPRYQMPSFSQLLTAVAESWVNQREEILVTGDELTQIIFQNPDHEYPAIDISQENFDVLTSNLFEDYDWKYGGWGNAPKFPQPMRLLFLLEQASYGNEEAQKIALHALDAMAEGGMYDVVGGGFARYSTDRYWLVPHFEKMLYDNALLARAYLYAYLLTRNPQYLRICEETLDFLLREMRHREGGFYSLMDADSEGEEGKFYIWSSDEIDEALPDSELNQLARTLYHIPVTGNWEGKIILHQMNTMEETARYFQWMPEEFEPKFQQMRQAMYAFRSKRIHPAVDDKVLVSWNALALQAFAEAARYLQRNDYLAAAQMNAEFLLANLMPEGELLRSWRQGKAQHHAFLEDHTGLGVALLSLYQSDPDLRWFAAAKEMTNTVLAKFYVERQGLFDSPADDSLLIARAQNLQDNAVPSGNAQAIHLMILMAVIDGKMDLYDLATQLLTQTINQIMQFPNAYCHWLSAYHHLLHPLKEIAIVGDPADLTYQEMISMLWSSLRADSVVIRASDSTTGQPALLEGRSASDGPTAYVCHQQTCLSPVTTVEELSMQV